MKKNLLYVVSGIVVVLAWALSGEIGEFVGRSAVDSYLEGRSRGAVEMAQAAAASELRSQLPIRVDDSTTLERVMSAGTTLIYQYSVNFSESDVDTTWHQNMKNMLATNVCKQSDMRYALDNGARYRYTYFGNDGVMIADFAVSELDCQVTDENVDAWR